MSLAAIIPAHNEEQTIAGVVAAALAVDAVAWVLVVDDGSSDDTAIMAEQSGAKVLTSSDNLGKGPRLVEGMLYAFGAGATHVILMDGDGQHDPADIAAFITASGDGTGRSDHG